MSELPPLAELVFSRLERGREEPYALGPAAMRAIGEALSAVAGTPALQAELGTLVEVAHFLDTKRGCPELAKALLELAEVAVEALHASKEALPRALDRLRGSAQSLARFEGDRREVISTDAPALSAAFLAAQLSKRNRRV